MPKINRILKFTIAALLLSACSPSTRTIIPNTYCKIPVESEPSLDQVFEFSGHGNNEAKWINYSYNNVGNEHKMIKTVKFDAVSETYFTNNESGDYFKVESNGSLGIYDSSGFINFAYSMTGDIGPRCRKRAVIVD